MTRASFLGIEIDRLTMEQSIERSRQLINKGGSNQHVVVNAAKIVAAHHDPELRRTISECALVNADGQAVVWASKLLGDPVPERVAGVDFMQYLWQACARHGFSVFLLGATEDTVRAVANIAVDRGVRVAGFRHGYWDAEDEGRIVRQVRESGAHVLFVAIPSPRKETFLSKHLEALGVALAVGVGGSFDVVAGKVKRAPLLLQRLGLEWAFRLAQEPRRMWRRYLVGNSKFLLLVLRELRRQRLHR